MEGEAARDALGYAKEGVERLARILDQLLMLARVEGRLAFEDGALCRPADVVALALRDSGAPTARFELPAAWPEVTLALPRELAVTALRNLIDNALRHGGEASRVTLEVACDDDKTLTFRVIDQGPGVDDDALAQMAGRFWRASKQHGSGLGLAIVVAIAERFAGHLEFVRPARGGLEARLTFPVQARHIAPEGP